ncbi:ABC transporter permease [Streptococcus caviae]|uniref:ABC transporter permease n=1 Tax=Streptococcus sp. 'caviae' TaxID=1915004 RepID=UPI00094B7E23|nr:ABC transporter permease [Streptococcus sp. 'caviae']OLN84582.1 multidrug ABC transporter permease [Streptococcus sp. 'caviae']
MKTIFSKRRFAFLTQSSKYLRYVFNDHFVLVLIFLLGFLMVQYSQLLKHFPVNHLPVIIVLSVVVAALLFWGNSATYLEPADQHFLIVKEKEVVSLIKGAQKRAFLFWGTLQLIFLLILAPLFLRLGMSFVSFVIFLLVFLALKWLIIAKKVQVFVHEGKLDWVKAISQERKRRQIILKFFSLFTNVKGLSASVKRRSYLDFVTGFLLRKHSHTWGHLYLRAFLRSGDYLGLTLRLGILSLLSLVFIANPLMSAGLAVLFNYLLLFQLLALYKHYDYQYLTRLFPIDSKAKKTNLKQFLRLVLYLLTAIEICFSFSWQKSLFLAAAMIILNELYLSYKIKKMID